MFIYVWEIIGTYCLQITFSFSPVVEIILTYVFQLKKSKAQRGCNVTHTSNFEAE